MRTLLIKKRKSGWTGPCQSSTCLCVRTENIFICLHVFENPPGFRGKLMQDCHRGPNCLSFTAVDGVCLERQFTCCELVCVCVWWHNWEKTQRMVCIQWEDTAEALVVPEFFCIPNFLCYPVLTPLCQTPKMAPTDPCTSTHADTVQLENNIQQHVSCRPSHIFISTKCMWINNAEYQAFSSFFHSMNWRVIKYTVHG